MFTSTQEEALWKVSGRPVFGAQHPPLSAKLSKKSTVLTSKKKDEEKFNDYTNNTNDAWEIDDGAMTSKILDDEDSTDCFQQTINQEYKSKKHRLGSTTGRQLDNPTSHIAVRSINTNSSTSAVDVDQQKRNKFQQMLQSTSIDLNELRKASWSGIPRQYRAQSWKLLCGYLPAKIERREETLTRKREEYWSYVNQYYHTRTDSEHQETFRQIQKDIPRMNHILVIFQQVIVQELFERILFIWAIRHPASGYVQGINDLVTPFFLVFLSELIDHDIEIEHFEISSLSTFDRRIVEADSFWATSYLLEGIQDNYTFAQPGIQYKLRTLEELIKRIDDSLYRHLKSQQIEFLQFAFRWMNNLLTREFPMRCTIRLWDTYLAEQNGFSQFHLYICAALLVRFSKDLLREKDFQGLLIFLQNLPTQSWTINDISILTAEAYQLNVMFADAPRHLANT